MMSSGCSAFLQNVLDQGGPNPGMRPADGFCVVLEQLVHVVFLVQKSPGVKIHLHFT